MVIKEIEGKDVMTKTNLPVSDFAVNPYAGCTHACKYCYASFMKRFTNHPEPDELYKEIYTKKSRACWEALDQEIRAYTAKEGMLCTRDDDLHRSPFGKPPVVCNYFYHDEETEWPSKQNFKNTAEDAYTG